MRIDGGLRARAAKRWAAVRRLSAPRFWRSATRCAGEGQPKRVRFIVSRPENAPKLVLVEGKKRGRPGLHLLPMLVTHTADGGFTEEMRRIYGEL
ncbi:MAG: hypothetical protein ACLUI3_17490 [Christensenellales bacterium]